MLNFEFSEEQKLFAESVREFGKKKIAPRAKEIEDKGKIPDDIIKGMADMGLLALTVSPEYGGADADPVLAGIAGEELGKADISCAVAVFYLVQAAWGHVFNKYGSVEAKKEILPGVTKGRKFLGIAATEPDAGSDLGGMRTTGKRSGDKYILNGEKMFISGVKEVNEQMPEGGGHLTLVKTAPELKTRGMSFFYVPLKNTKGISPTLLEDWGRKGISTGGFALKDVEVPLKYRVGEENKGFYIAMEGFDYARAIISVVCCGAAMGALEYAMTYLKQRKTFGQYIGKYEGVQFKLAEHWSKLEALKLLSYKALWMYGKEQKEKKFSRHEVTKIAAEAKTLAPMFAFEAINDAMQWFGAFGYTTECPLERGLKGVRSYYWAEGAAEIMRIIVARELLGKEFVAYR
ncbi:MAG: acyl-CoA dehydrogenase family protein [Thermoplasmata archaeon]